MEESRIRLIRQQKTSSFGKRSIGDSSQQQTNDDETNIIDSSYSSEKGKLKATLAIPTNPQVRDFSDVEIERVAFWSKGQWIAKSKPPELQSHYSKKYRTVAASERSKRCQ
jgi:hypothetical protein